MEYKKDTYYWELVAMFTKICIVIISIVYDSYHVIKGIKNLKILIILIFFLII